MQITAEQLFNLLLKVNRATPVTLTTVTEPDMVKTDNPLAGRVVKVSRVNGMACWSYANAINKALEKQGEDPTYQPQPSKWGERLPGTPLIAHKGKHYIELKVQASLGHEYQDATTGEVIPDDVVKPYLRPSKPNPLAPTVILRDYALTNVRQIAIGGDVHQVA